MRKAGLGWTQRGFTLVEMLIVVLIIAVLMAVATPQYLSTQQNASKRACRANMQTIANAVQASRVANHTTDYSNYIGKPVDSAHEQDLSATPVCTANGTYSIAQGNSSDNTTFKVVCSAAGHGTFQPGVDGQ